jgi:hypothetical protein
MVMAFSAIIQANRAKTSLRSLIESYFVEDSAKPYFTEDSYLRASSFGALCPREEVICSLEKRERRNRFNTDLLLTFAHGTGLHWVMQNEILPKTGVLLGQWLCLRCNKRHGGRPRHRPLEMGLMTRPLHCRRCGHDKFVYNELHFKDDAYRVSGHPDGFLRLPSLPGLGLLEIKSVSERSSFEIRNTPNINHVIQAHVYFMLTGLKWAVFIYWNKGAFGAKALIEHFIEEDRETTDAVKKTALEIQRGIREGILPERICSDSSCSRARDCVVVGPCFSMTERYRGF